MVGRRMHFGDAVIGVNPGGWWCHDPQNLGWVVPCGVFH